MSKRKNEDNEELDDTEKKKVKLTEGEETTEADKDVTMAEKEEKKEEREEKEEKKEEKEEKKEKSERRGRSKSPTRKRESSKSPVRSKSPLRSFTKKKEDKLKRSGTMDSTVDEALEFLGDSELLKTRGNVPETRGRTKARQLLTEFVSGDDRTYTNEKIANLDEKTLQEIEATEREKLKALFYLFDTTRAGYIGEEQLADILRSMGKRPVKDKIRKLVKDISSDGKIDLNRFVKYFSDKRMNSVKKQYQNVKPKEEKKPTSKSPKRKSRSKSPAKKSKSPSKKSKSPTKQSKRSKSPTKKSPKKKVEKGTVVKSPTRSSPVNSSYFATSPSSSSAPLATSPAPVVDNSKRFKPLPIDPRKLQNYFQPKVSESGEDLFDKVELGKDTAFGEFSILVYSTSNLSTPLVDYLRNLKGFNVTVTSTVDQFVEKLTEENEEQTPIPSEKNNIENNNNNNNFTIKECPNTSNPYHTRSDYCKERYQGFDAVWVFVDQLKQDDKLMLALEEYYKSSRGIAVFTNAEVPEGAPLTDDLPDADNSANSLTDDLFSFVVKGAFKGDEKNTLALPRYDLFSGVKDITEGSSFSHIDNPHIPADGCIVKSAHSHPVIVAKNFSSSYPPRGRVVVDAGSSRFALLNTPVIADDAADAAARRNLLSYAANIAVWLLGLDKRVLTGFPIRGSISKLDIDYVWQYKHGGWYNYTSEGSRVVEEAYQGYVQNPGKCDVRSVKSGQWAYLVDFLNFTQTNTQHHDHTQREIRRVPRFLSTF